MHTLWLSVCICSHLDFVLRSKSDQLHITRLQQGHQSLHHLKEKGASLSQGGWVGDCVNGKCFRHPKIDISRFTVPTYESCGLRTVFHNFAFRWGSGVATRIWWWDGGFYTNSDAFVEKSLRIPPCFFFQESFNPPKNVPLLEGG